jgi:hypothetical protein
MWRVDRPSMACNWNGGDAYRKGGEVSDRQWRDVLAIIRVQASQLDRLYLREHAPVLGVDDLLTRALREASR